MKRVSTTEFQGIAQGQLDTRESPNGAGVGDYLDQI